ncbi:MAG: prolipoprotein diacylglyceryl transferase [candidate division Zixibacteria bacterium RBG_16_53_22]|nr:MAG: prolipoprotein diacylglyceryl transferase [candidate division Zixibacteria bacterium RBG_16_53_22]
MYPEPLKFIGISFVRSYGLLLAISFLLGVYLSIKRANKAGLNQNAVIDLSFIVLVAALIGSRFFYVIYHTEEFSNNLLDIINPFHSGYVGIAGLSMMGGVVLAIIAAFLFFMIKRMSPWPVCDVMMPMFALGIGITRIGCFLNGCCFGLPTHSPLGVIFPSDSLAGYVFPDTPLIPTQIYEAIAGFVILFIVLWSERFKKFDGHSFWITLGLYGAWRFSIDFYRYYEDSMVFATIDHQHLSRNQLLSALLVVGSIVAYIITYTRWRRQAGTRAGTSVA